MLISSYRYLYDLDYVMVHDTDEIFIPFNFYDLKDFIGAKVQEFGGRDRMSSLVFRDITFSDLEATRCDNYALYFLPLHILLDHLQFRYEKIAE